MNLPTDRSLFDQKLSTSELLARIHAEINKLHTMVYDLEARVDTAFPGADLQRHRTDHERMYDDEQNTRSMWHNLRDKSLFGLVIFLLVVAGVVLWQAFKFGAQK